MALVHLTVDDPTTHVAELLADAINRHASREERG